MANDQIPASPDGLPADNSRNWPGLAALLAPDGGCECQMLALTIADGFGKAAPISPVTAQIPAAKL